MTTRVTAPVAVAVSGALQTAGPAQGGILVALSGGVDSVVLLYLLRFAGVWEGPLFAAHLDHALRQDSPGDADWVRGLCRAWNVPLFERRLDSPPAGEAAARDARYAFLNEVRDQVGASLIATGHHADDQAETVLFRIARGTGVRGLAGIPLLRDGICRPLLQVSRAQVLDFAGAVGLKWREDSTNLGGDNTRARIRNQVLPLLEAQVAPGATAALARLADHARSVDSEFEALVDALWKAGGVETKEGRITIPVALLDQAHPAVADRIIRAAGARLGVALDAAGTLRVRGATRDLKVGGQVDVIRGVTLHRTRDGWRMDAPLVSRPMEDLSGVAPDRPGEGIVSLGRRRLRVAWGATAPPQTEKWLRVAHLEPDSVTFPLTVRGWRSGDRIRLAHGSSTVARLLSESGVPRPDRPETAVVVGADGGVLWVPDLGKQAARTATATQAIWMGIGNAGE